MRKVNIAARVETSGFGDRFRTDQLPVSQPQEHPRCGEKEFGDRNKEKEKHNRQTGFESDPPVGRRETDNGQKKCKSQENQPTQTEIEKKPDACIRIRVAETNTGQPLKRG